MTAVVVVESTIMRANVRWDWYRFWQSYVTQIICEPTRKIPKKWSHHRANEARKCRSHETFKGKHESVRCMPTFQRTRGKLTRWTAVTFTASQHTHTSLALRFGAETKTESTFRGTKAKEWHDGAAKQIRKASSTKFHERKRRLRRWKHREPRLLESRDRDAVRERPNQAKSAGSGKGMVRSLSRELPPVKLWVIVKKMCEFHHHGSSFIFWSRLCQRAIMKKKPWWLDWMKQRASDTAIGKV